MAQGRFISSTVAEDIRLNGLFDAPHPLCYSIDSETKRSPTTFATARRLLCRQQLNVSTENPSVKRIQSAARVVLRMGLATSTLDRRVLRVLSEVAKMCKYRHHSAWAYCGPGFIYVATDGELCKIGSTKKYSRYYASNHTNSGVFASVSARLSDLKRKSGRKFRLTHIIYCPVCIRAVESELHALFNDKRVGREEWFRLDEDDLSVIRSLQSFDGHELLHREGEL